LKRNIKRGSYGTEAMHRDAHMSFTHNFLKTPRGKMGLAVFGKLFDMKNIEPEQLWDLLFENGTIDEVRNMIAYSPKITNDERYILYDIINEFSIHDYRDKLDRFKTKRAENLQYRDIDFRDPGDYPSMESLGLRKKKLVKKPKPKRKPVKKCRCK